MKSIRRALFGIIVATAALWQNTALAGWPDKPIKLIWPYAPGGLGYSLSRLIADGLSERLGQPVIIDVKPGAGGTVGAGFLKLAPADGYTIMLGTIAPLSLAPGLYGKSLSYDPTKDFEPIALTFVGPNMIVINASNPIKTFQEFVAFAKNNPGKLSYGTAGNGSTFQLTAGLFSQITNGEMINVPYKGGAPAFMALLANDISVVFGNTDALPHIAAGKLRALAVMSPRRLSFVPEVPTTAELGMPELMLESWYGLVAPAGTPKEIIDRLNKETAAILVTTKVQEALKTLNTETARDTSVAHMKKTIASEIMRWRPIIQAAGIKPD